MKISNIAAITIITITALLLTGCQEEAKQQLADCQVKSAELEATVKTQQEDIEKYINNEKAFGTAFIDNMVRTETLQKENDVLKKENAALKKSADRLTNKAQQTPEQKAKIQKGLQDLFRLQKESAERMKKEAQK